MPLEVMGATVNIKPKLTSDAIHNRNCYAYFLQLKPLINSQVTKLLPEFSKLQLVMGQEYNENFPYGDVYSSCIASLEEFIDNNSDQKNKVLDDLVLAIYNNDNHILEEASEWINDIGAKIRPRSVDTAKKIEKK